jgi:hypothetical protein
MMEAMTPSGYRLQMSVLSRLWRVVFSVVLAVAFVSVLVNADATPMGRVGAVVGIGLAVMGLRVALGPAVILRADGLRYFTFWPRHHDIPWYRVFAVDVVPGRWVLELELNSGDRVTLPIVERVDDLYEQIEELRQRLDV